MSTKPSELMLDLLKELTLIKELDQQYENVPRSGVEVVEFESRQNRRREISHQMKALAAVVSNAEAFEGERPDS
jgi:hypothetical protein